jgi:hypothetical protein
MRIESFLEAQREENSNIDEHADAVLQALIIAVDEDKESMVAMLQRSGSLVTEMSSRQEILDSAFNSLKDSPRFQNDLATYLTAHAMGYY